MLHPLVPGQPRSKWGSEVALSLYNAGEMRIPPTMHCVILPPPPNILPCHHWYIPLSRGGRRGRELTLSLEMLAREEGSFFDVVGKIMFFRARSSPNANVHSNLIGPPPLPHAALIIFKGCLRVCACLSAFPPSSFSSLPQLCIRSVVFQGGQAKNQAADFRIPLPYLFPLCTCWASLLPLRCLFPTALDGFWRRHIRLICIGALCTLNSLLAHQLEAENISIGILPFRFSSPRSPTQPVPVCSWGLLGMQPCQMLTHTPSPVPHWMPTP